MTIGGEGAGLYVHVPFCSFVCPYCDFAVARWQRGAEQPWLAALLKEAELRAWTQPIDTLYLGGGTPSLLRPEQLERLVGGLRERLPIAPAARLFMEANPEDVSAQNLAHWQDLGLHFLSLGIQSFDAAELKFLGRRHDADGARAALALAMAADLDIVSVDLIFGLPDQQLATWLANIEAASAAGIDHLSCYQLTIKPGTLFAKRQELGRLTEISDGMQGDFFLATHQALRAAGLGAYEVSNFARSEATESAHNRKYWRQVPYLGLGPAAHSFTGTQRFWNLADEAIWRRAVNEDRLPTEATEDLSLADRLLETLMLRLRTRAGVDLGWLESEFDYRPNPRQRRRLEEFIRAGLLAQDGSILRPTTKGMAVADSLAADLAPDDER